MWSARPLSSIPLSAGPSTSASAVAATLEAENGWAAWTYSKTAKLNAWSWHSLGTADTAKVNAWATIGNSIYVRRDDDELFYVLRPNSYFEATDDNPESSKVYAETQWLDFGKPGNLKALTGLDFDGLNVTSVLVYVSVDGDRIGQLADTILVGSAQGGWTYSGGVLPVDAAGTEFKLRFVGDANLEVQVNRLTIYFDDLGTS